MINCFVKQISLSVRKGDSKICDFMIGQELTEKVKVDQKVKRLTRRVNNVTVWSFDKQYGKILRETVFTDKIASNCFKTTIEKSSI